jgi:hypothetical protein
MAAICFLSSEFCSLKHIDGKIDHPSDGSKDISDATAGSVFDCYLQLDLAQQISSSERVTSQLKTFELLQNMTSEFMNALSNTLFK